MATKHPFKILESEYTVLLAKMVVIRNKEVDATAKRLLKNLGYYRPVSVKTGIPIPFIAASFEREASSRFNRSPAQGDPWNKVSTNVPRGRGPFKSWQEAALDAYALNGLDKVGAGNWTWELLCFYGEIFNGMGYRDYRGIPSPYLWGGTNIQRPGKYTSDGKYDPTHLDMQLGIVPIMKRMIELDPSVGFDDPEVMRRPLPAPVGVGGGEEHDAKWIQRSLNKLGADPKLNVDGSYGKKTIAAVKEFQQSVGIEVDGFAGKQTIGKLIRELERRG